MATLINFIILLLFVITLCLIIPTLANSDSKKVHNNDLLDNIPTPSYNNIPNSNTPQNVDIMNTIDSCWRKNSNWASNRQSLADCTIGFGKNAIGGKYGEIYEVTDPSDDPINPKQGTLRYGAIQTEPLWITFANDMFIKLKNELIVNSYKTIDGRGVKVEIGNGPCITIQGVSHVIVHGISIHDCKPGEAGLVRSSNEHVGYREGCDGDGISVFASSNVWIDHCFLARCADGLTDVTHASTLVTISNSYFTQHDKVSKYNLSSLSSSDFCGENHCFDFSKYKLLLYWFMFRTSIRDINGVFIISIHLRTIMVTDINGVFIILIHLRTIMVKITCSKTKKKKKNQIFT
jgi:pectate lyase